MGSLHLNPKAPLVPFVRRVGVILKLGLMASEKFDRKTTTKSTAPINRDRKPTVPNLFFCGVAYTAAAPLERLKLLLQVQNSPDAKFKGTIQGLKYIWKTEGFRGLFKGNGINCARLVSYSSVKVFNYEQASRGILWLSWHKSGKEDAKFTPLLHLGASACAGIVAMSATYPMDMVWGRLAVQTGKFPYQYRGMFHALSTVAREEGLRALYKGFLPSAIGLVMFMNLNFIVYEFLKDRLMKATIQSLVKYKEFGLVKDRKLSAKQIELVKEAKLGSFVLTAVVSGTIALQVAYPFDVIHRRMQMVGWKTASSIVTGDGTSKALFEYTGMVDAFRKTVRNEGFEALYKGWAPNLLKVGPAVLAFGILQSLKDVLGVEVSIKSNPFVMP